VGDAKSLQNAFVSGGGGGRRGGGRGAATSGARTVTASITLASGEKVEGRLVRIDDFLVTITNVEGVTRTFRRVDDTPKVEIHDPMQAHRDLLSIYTDKDMHDVTAYLVTLK
jgi:cytochrome c oxidase cbb3-type subunit 3